MSRKRDLEALDDLSLSGPPLARTLRELGALNRWLGNTRAIARAAVRAAADLREVSVVDLACGGGDILAATGAALRAQGITPQLLGIDGNPNTITWARDQYPEATFSTVDILAPDFVVPACDVLLISHFLYHLPDEQVVPFLSRQRAPVRVATLISELVRSTGASWGFRVLSSLLQSGPITREDGLLAIERAWTQAELEGILSALPPPWTLHRVDPFRMIVQVG